MKVVLNLDGKLFRKHDYKISERSNVIQLDDMGYHLRLCILKCHCGATKQAWIDTKQKDDDVILKWSSING